MFHVQTLTIAASLAISCASALAIDSSSTVVRDTDKFHLDVREFANRTTDNVKVFVRADLCARAGEGKEAVCTIIATVKPLDVAGKAVDAGSNIVKYPDGAQSERALGTDLNAQASRLREKVGGSASFRIVTTVNVSRNGSPEEIVYKDFSEFPKLDVEGPVAEKGAIITRRQWDSKDKKFGGRILVVTTRKAQ